MKNSISRRSFLQRSAGVAATVGFPTIIPTSVLGKDAPSNQLIGAAIGLGGQGNGNMRAFMRQAGTKVIAVCDVYGKNAKKAKGWVDYNNRNKDCKMVKDYREIAHDPSIDVVIQGTPDHWHAVTSIECLKNGKDMYGEKPLTRHLKEGRELVDTVHRYGRVWQTGSWQRSRDHFRHACELVINGRIGKVQRVEVGLPGGRGGSGSYKPQTPPADLDWDFWCGPAPLSSYDKDSFIFNWRWNLDYGGGSIMDWVGHHVDIAHWGLGKDETGPVKFKPIKVQFPRRGRWNAPRNYRIECTYADGIELIISGGAGTKWIGTDGWVSVDRGGMNASSAEIAKSKPGPGEKKLYRSNDHMQNFVDCVRSRKQTITPAEYAHRSASVGHLCLIALQLGREIKFNPDTEEIIGDTAATALLSRNNRAPYTI